MNTIILVLLKDTMKKMATNGKKYNYIIHKINSSWLVSNVI